MSKKRKVIIDCDPGIDDALALILACKSEDLDILGITITAGNVDGKQCAQNALDILKQIDREDIPVYIGAEKPLKIDRRDAKETHGENGLGGIRLETSDQKAKTGAVEFIADSLKNHDNLSIIALGPLTNLALLIKEHPEAVERLEELVLMGGNYAVQGNCSPVAEFNFWSDPDAAKIVFENLNKPITMTGLDVTRQALMTPNYSELMKHYGWLGELIAMMLKHYDEFHWKQEGVLGSVINDPLAVAQFINPQICDGFDAYVTVITDGENQGMSFVDDTGFLNKEPNCRVLTKLDKKAFFKFLFNTIFPEKSKITDQIIDNEIYGV